MRPILLWTALAACTTPSSDAPPLPASSAPQIEAWIDDRSGGTDLVVRTVLPTSDDRALDPVAPDGVELSARRDTVEVLGDRQVTTARYRVGGSAGRYILDRLCLTGSGEPLCASPVYVDLAVPGGPDQMADLVEPEPVAPGQPWGLLLAATAGVAGLGALLLWAVTRARERDEVQPVAPDIPPWERAMQRWETVRHDDALTALDQAHALSEITRTYLDEVLSFPAAKWSTTEIVAHLERLTALPEGNVPRVRRLLRATDRVKYAGATPGDRFFEELDADLRALIDGTRPRQWQADRPEGSA